jgi:hypothetical protein
LELIVEDYNWLGLTIRREQFTVTSYRLGEPSGDLFALPAGLPIVEDGYRSMRRKR